MIYLCCIDRLPGFLQWVLLIFLIGMICLAFYSANRGA